MANWNGLQLTNKGIALQAKVQAGTELEITKLKLGSGVVPSGTDIKTLTDLITPEQNLGIGGTEAVGDYCKVSATISNSGLEAGYYVRELGVFAQDPDEGEILYLYATDGAPDYLPAGGGSTVISQEFNVMIAVNDTDNVSVEIASDTLNEFGLNRALQNAIGKIIANGAKPDEIDKTSMLISWYFSHYKDLKNSRQYQYMLRNCISTESSKLIQLMLMLSLKEIDGVTTSDDRYFKSKYMTESTKRKGLLYQMKKNGLRSIEEDLFEYNMRLRNLETQDDAILLMRQINSRMSILEEYLDTEELDEKDRKRWEDCYKKYLELRDALSKKTVYNKKMYGLFVDYNALQNMSQSGNLMNTYY